MMGHAEFSCALDGVYVAQVEPSIVIAVHLRATKILGRL
jgi:hypothetical protein